ncbi:MAG: PCRF domain-containing protein, partial [Oscillospiraceae bacterium]
AFDALWEKYEDALTLLEITAEEEGEDALEEVHQYAVELNHSIENMRLSTLLRGEYDGLNAIISFHAGAGGTEAQDWADLL